MTQIDASPVPTGKAAARADAGALRDRGKGGQADGDAGMDSAKPRFGDHWRSILSGDARKPDGEAVSADEGELAGDKASSSRIRVMLRLPSMTHAAQGDAPEGKVPALGTNAASPGEIDISEVLAALKRAGVDAGDATVEAVAGDARKPHGGIEESDALEAIVATEAGEADAIRVDAVQRAPAGEIPTDPAARDASAQPAVANVTAQSATPSADPAAPAEPKARMRGAVANAPVEKGSSNAMSDLHLATRADAARPAMKASVVHQATHFAPALGAANIQAISSALTEAAGDLRPGTERTGTDPTMQQPGARPTGPVKTLTIQLTPIALGKITVEMRMIGGTMKVDIQVADPKALEMVRSDKDLIVNLLRKAGVVPDTITIQTAENASSARQNQAGQGGAGGFATHGEASRDGSDGSGRNAGPDDHDQGRMSHEDRSTDQSRLRGDIYL